MAISGLISLASLIAVPNVLGEDRLGLELFLDLEGVVIHLGNTF